MPRSSPEAMAETLPSRSKKLFEFREGISEGEWLVIQGKEGETLEGALFKPKPPDDKHELIIFHPGLPGDGVVWFEEKHVPELVKAGYTVFTARHAGLRYTKNNEKYIHNPERLHYGNLGKSSIEVTDWLKEPQIALEFFSSDPNYRAISLVTHSFSGLSATSSLIDLQQKYGSSSENPLTKIKKWLLLSGFTSDLRQEGFWDPDRRSLNLDLYEQFLTQVRDRGLYPIADSKQSLEQLKAASQKMTRQMATLPDNFGVVGVYPEKDRMLSINAGLDLQKNLGRGLIIDDKTFRQEKFTPETDAHDFPHLLPAALLRLIEMKISKTTRQAKVEKSEPRNS